MTDFCSFHTTTPAHFHCQNCDSLYCDQCISVREINEYSGKQRYYFCSACDLPARMLSVGNMIEPFWKKLSSIFLYPFQPVPLILTLLLSILGAVFPSTTLVRLFVWVVMVKYAFAVFINTSQGGLRAPMVSWELINGDVKPVLQQYLLFILVSLATQQIFIGFGMVAGYLFVALVALALPVIIMVQVATNSILHAVNPMLCFPIIFRIGWPYLLMYLFLFFLYSGPRVVLAYLPVDVLPYPLVVFCMLFLTQYYALVSYHLMGYVLLQFHDEIGYPVDYDFFITNQGGKPKKALSEKQELENAVTVLVRMGKYQEALHRLAPHIRESEVDPDLSERFFKLLRLVDDKKHIGPYGVRHLDILVAAGRKEKALALFAELKDNKEHPLKAENVFTIAGWYKSRTEYRKAIETYAYFLKTYKTDPLRPEAYFNLARLLHERGKNTGKAKEILTAVIKHYPQHAMSAKASRYLADVA